MRSFLQKTKVNRSSWPRLFKCKSLKEDPQSLRRALKIVQLFAKASGSQCNIKKSWLISLTESDGFDYARRMGDVVDKGKIFCHLGAPLGCYTSSKQAFERVQERIQTKLRK